MSTHGSAHLKTVYHHTLILTFRPFLILRAKLRQEALANRLDSTNQTHKPPSYLDKACEYCLEAARNTISFLAGACEANILCHVCAL